LKDNVTLAQAPAEISGGSARIKDAVDFSLKSIDL
jgi:hypothetical protein